MGPPSTSFSQTTTITPMNQAQKPPQSTPLTTQIPPGVSLGMSPTSRYNHNIKVLRRRDPSIMSIFDQFSHVCLYHHDGTKWVKNGYEGTMFLFERNTYPPYGFYILNRVGAGDCIHPIYPEDEFCPTGEFLIIKSFPDFLKARLAAIPPTPTGEPHDKFSDVYHIPEIDKITKDQKGRAEVIGLWMMHVSSRDAMNQTLKRLHSFVRLNKPYPEEFRYGPGKPPPPHSLKAAPRPKVGSNSESESHHTSQSDSEYDAGNQSDAPSVTSERMSEIDLLFQNIQVPSVPPTPSHVNAQPTKVTLDTLFASASAQQSLASPVGSTGIPASPSTTSASNGPSLLNTIFASAASNQKIYSPQPSTNGPQVLTQDVLSNLLGLPSRTASAASTFSTSESSVSHPSSREGDNEDDGESESPGGFFDTEDNEAYPRFNLAKQAGSDLLTTLGFGNVRHHGRTNGDVTPRVPMDGLPHRPQIPSAIETASSISTVRGVESSSNRRGAAVNDITAPAPPAAGKPRANRTLVPFEPDSELWPYSRGPVDESSPTDGNDDGDIVELNFEDTSVLSDPDAFDTALRSRRSTVSLRGSANGHNPSATGHLNGSPAKGGVDEARGKKAKKARKEAKIREEIEKSWDYPTPSPTALIPSHQDILDGPPASPSPCPSPELGGASLAPVPEMKTPTMNANAVLGYINSNGYAHGSLQQNGKGKAASIAVNGRTKFNGHISRVDPAVVSESLVETVAAQPHPIGKLERNEFVKEVLTLIHTDKAFVDTLWQQYMAHFA